MYTVQLLLRKLTKIGRYMTFDILSAKFGTFSISLFIYEALNLPLYILVHTWKFAFWFLCVVLSFLIFFFSQSLIKIFSNGFFIFLQKIMFDVKYSVNLNLTCLIHRRRRGELNDIQETTDWHPQLISSVRNWLRLSQLIINYD